MTHDPKDRSGWRSIGAQSLARIVALAIPLALVFLARFGLADGASTRFFTLLTDAVAIAAVARLGVDIYLPVCRIEDGKMHINPTYMWLFHGLSATLMAAPMIWPLISTQPLDIGFSPQALGIGALVMQAAMLAEIGRARDSYLTFYMLKAPTVYIGALIWALWLFADLPGLNVFGLALVTGMISVNLSLSQGDATSVDWRAVITDSVLSMLRTVSAWQASFAVRLMGDGQDLETTVLYTRMVVAVTFLFAIYNARIANKLRGLDVAPTLADLRRINTRPLRVTLPWALATSALICAFAALFDQSNLLIATVLMLSNVVLVIFGNLAPIFVSLRQTKTLLLLYLGSIAFFAALFWLLSNTMETLMAMALATLFTTLLRGSLLKGLMPRALRQAKGNWGTK